MMQSSSATYEIHLQDAPPDTLVARFGPTEVTRARAQTVLVRRVGSQDELGNLLERVLSMGLVLDEVHELRVASSLPCPARAGGVKRDPRRAYEVRVAGRLEEPLLRMLRWQHTHVPEHARLSLEGTPDDLHEFLDACCSLGLGIDRVRCVSRRLARALDGPRPRAG